MKRLLFLMSVAGSVACSPAEERTVLLDGCEEVKVTGVAEMRLVDMDLPMVRIRGDRQAVADAGVTHQSSRVSIEGSGISVEVGCPELRALELLGEVAADLGETAAPIERLAVYGSSALAGKGFNATDLDVRASGRGAISMADMQVGDVQLLAAGDSRIALAGSAAELTLDATGRTRVDAASLRVQTVGVKASGETEIAVWATAHLNARARGNAQVVYTGDPDLSVDAEAPASVAPAS